MSLLIPNWRDEVDAYADLDQDDMFIKNRDIRKSKLHEYWDFEHVDGFFKQSDPETNDLEFNYGSEDFGIQTGDWNQLVGKLNQLNESSSDLLVSYKLFFLARHGQGWHNVANHKFGQDLWWQKWRFLCSDGEIEWGPDADLTPLGVNQAKENNELWKQQLQKGAPIPSKFYVSPMRRSSYTLRYTWDGINLPMKPIVVENVRETIGLHPCHQRSTKQVISERFPEFQFEPDFAENDEIFEKYTPEREKLHQQFMRVNLFLERVFENDNDSIISVTSHAGTIRAFITAVGHRKFTIPTGGMIPIVVKATKRTRD